jgi:hypothetical protein
MWRADIRLISHLQNKFNSVYNANVEPLVCHLMLVVTVISSKVVSTFDNQNHT